MALTADYHASVQDRVRRSVTFRQALLREAMNAMIEGELEVGKSLLRDYINGSIGFQELALLLERSPKSLMRMLSPTGNPQARNLFAMLQALQKYEGVKLELRTRRAA